MGIKPNGSGTPKAENKILQRNKIESKKTKSFLTTEVKEDRREKNKLHKVKGGKVKKPRPLPKKVLEANKNARKAFITGELASDEAERRQLRNARTLYVRFKDKNNLPKDADEVRKLHNGIKLVRLQRRAQKRLLYAFVEFGSEAQCIEAHGSLRSNASLYIDFVGSKSRNIKNELKRGEKSKAAINPIRLLVSGLVPGMNEEKLRQLFPKCHIASIPKTSQQRGASYGFVQFYNPGDAKAAFNAAQKLKLSVDAEGGSHHITVTYARMSKRSSRSENVNEGSNMSKGQVKRRKKEEQVEGDKIEGDTKEESQNDNEDEELENNRDIDGESANEQVKRGKELADEENKIKCDTREESDSDNEDEELENDEETDGESDNESIPE